MLVEAVGYTAKNSDRNASMRERKSVTGTSSGNCRRWCEASRPLPSGTVTSAAWLRPVGLEGRMVRLEPLRRDHLDGLAELAFDPALWQYTLARPTDRAALEAWLEAALANADAGREVPF